MLPRQQDADAKASEAISQGILSVPPSFVPDTDHGMLPLFCGERPPLPEGLSTLQRARLSDLLMYIHETLQLIINDARETDDHHRTVVFAWQRFQNLLLLQQDLAVWLGNAAGSRGR
ncbi:MAG UNVERIFIED_CONTAM: hypothetical protein LVR18_48825 [Planctomycetaceae bacterium]